MVGAPLSTEDTTLEAALLALLAALLAALAALDAALPAALAADEPMLEALEAISPPISRACEQLTATAVAIARQPVTAAARVKVVFIAPKYGPRLGENGRENLLRNAEILLRMGVLSGYPLRRSGTDAAPARSPMNASLPPSKVLAVRAADGTALHAEVFGPRRGYPIVLAHGITCSIRVWHEQINDLARDFRVIAYDHRGHGRSAVPGPKAYSLDHLAADLDAVLDAALRPGERALIAGHSMGGIAINSWSARFRDSVARRADAVALINTTTGDLLKEIRLLRVPGVVAPARIAAARNMIRAVGGAPLFRGAQPGSRWFLRMMAVGEHADPAICDFLHDLFAATPPAGRGAWARVLVDEMGSRHIDLSGLTVPTLVIGSSRDRLLPMCQSRKIAKAAPNLVELVEMAGGHCAMLEHPGEVNRRLRELAGLATSARRIS